MHTHLVPETSQELETQFQRLVTNSPELAEPLDQENFIRFLSRLQAYIDVIITVAALENSSPYPPFIQPFLTFLNDETYPIYMQEISGAIYNFFELLCKLVVVGNAAENVISFAKKKVTAQIQEEVAKNPDLGARFGIKAA